MNRVFMLCVLASLGLDHSHELSCTSEFRVGSVLQLSVAAVAGVTPVPTLNSDRNLRFDQLDAEKTAELASRTGVHCRVKSCHRVANSNRTTPTRGN
jgi:hypothetical protein